MNKTLESVILIIGILFITSVVFKTSSCVSDEHKGERWSCYEQNLMN